MNLSISKQNNVSFKNFKYKNMEYISEKMTPETKEIFKQARQTMNHNRKNRLENGLTLETFEKTTPVTTESGTKSGSYLAYPGNASKGSLVMANNGEIGMYYKHYAFIKKSNPNYDLNKDAQGRIKNIINE